MSVKNHELKVGGYNIFPQLELNIMVRNEFINNDIVKQLFNNEEYITLHPSWNMYDILWMFGIFKSKSEARKNWTRTGKEIPPGYNEFRNIGKQRKSLFIWNPIKIKESEL